MHITGAEIFKQNGWYNLRLFGTTPEPAFRYDAIERDGKTYYFAETEDGWVSFFAHDPRNQSGFGGSLFTLTMDFDGSQRQVRGPWSSRPSVMLALGFSPCVEASINMRAVSLTIEAAQRILDEFCPEYTIHLGHLYPGSEIQYVILPKSEVTLELAC